MNFEGFRVLGFQFVRK